MEALMLANGQSADAGKLRTYFSGILKAEQSGDEYPVNLAHVWPIGYSRKDNAVAALRKNYVEGVDYVSSLRIKEREIGATTETEILLTVSCAEHFAVRANREVFEVYRACRKAVAAVVRSPLPDFSDPVAAARAWADAEEARRLAEVSAAAASFQLAEAAPKVEFYDAVAAASNTIPIGELAKVLNIPGLGPVNLFRRLRADHILLSTNLPYQEYIERGWFEVKQGVFESAKGQQISKQTRVTGKGVEALARRYKLGGQKNLPSTTQKVV